MIYLKSYCYSDHELPFIIANLYESYDHIDKFYLYEYNRTHTGLEKKYNLEKHIGDIPSNLRDKLVYRMIDVSKICEYAYENERLIHIHNEPIQRSYFYYDPEVPKLNDNDIIIDIDIDEIIYNDSYPKLISDIRKSNRPMSIKLNQFFFRHNYLWRNCSFSSPSIYTYSMVKNRTHKIRGIPIQNCRDLAYKTNEICGAHMSWIMPTNYMVKKLHCYSHPKYRKYADYEKLNEAIRNKVYIFDEKREFEIDDMSYTDRRIPSYLQRENIFDFIEDNADIKNL